MGQRKEHLKKRGITQTWLAKEFGISFSITSTYVCNRKAKHYHHLQGRRPA